MICKQYGKNNKWIERGVITNIHINKDQNYILCECGNKQDAISEKKE